MPDIKTAYAAATALTIAVNSLANSSTAGRQSTVVDNSSNLYNDALVSVKVTSGASGVSASGFVAVYAYASADDGVTYTGNAGASDAAITNATILRFLGRFAVVANSTVYVGGPFSVASAFGGCLPKSWGIAVLNSSGATLSATGNSVAMQGVYNTVA